MEINHYYHDYVVTLNDRRFPEPDVTEAEMFVFLTLTIQTGHGVRDKVTDYWATTDQLHTLFYGTMKKRGGYQHILSYLHFTDNRNEPDRMDINFDSRTMALGLTQPLTEMSTRNISWGVKAAGAYG